MNKSAQHVLIPHQRFVVQNVYIMQGTFWLQQTGRQAFLSHTTKHLVSVAYKLCVFSDSCFYVTFNFRHKTCAVRLGSGNDAWSHMGRELQSPGWNFSVKLLKQQQDYIYFLLEVLGLIRVLSNQGLQVKKVYIQLDPRGIVLTLKDKAEQNR